MVNNSTDNENDMWVVNVSLSLTSQLSRNFNRNGRQKLLMLS